jgi:anaerobic selenocysteine-containing dehydrogenase
MDRISNQVTRRALLRGAAGAAGAATFAGLAAVAGPALAASKITQKAVSYQDTPKGNAKCSGCALFESPDECENVSGVISPDGWCKIYRPKQKGAA